MRKIVIAPLLALALTIPAVAPALASGSTDRSRASHGAAAHRSDRTQVEDRLTGRHGKPKRIRFVEIGTIGAIDATGSTLTLTVRRGTTKAIRGGSVDIGLTTDTVIRRNGDDAALSDLQAGDRVVVEGVRTGSSYVALRVRARTAKTLDDGTGPTPTPSPSVTPTPAPTPVPTPTPSATAVS